MKIMKIVKINNGGPLVMGTLIDQTSIHGLDTYIVKPAVGIVQEEGTTKMFDLIPFTIFDEGIEFPATSVEFIANPTDDLVAEYHAFCDDVANDVKVETTTEPQLLVEGNDNS